MKKVIITGILILVGILNGAAIYSVFAGPVNPPSQDVILSDYGTLLFMEH